MSRLSSCEPSGRSTPLTVKGRPPTTDAVAGPEVQRLRGRRAGNQLAAGGAAAAVHLPPSLEPNSSRERTPMTIACLPSTFATPEQLRRDEGDVATVGDSVDARQVGLLDRAAADRDAAQRHAAVREGEPVACAASTMMLAPYISRLFCACTRRAALSVSSATTVPIPMSRPTTRKAARPLRRRRFWKAT